MSRTDILEAARELAATAPPDARERLLVALAEGVRQQYPGHVVTPLREREALTGGHNA
jgi:hypothetical protein